MPVTGMPEVVGDRVQTCPRCGDTYNQEVDDVMNVENGWDKKNLQAVHCGYCHCLYPVCKICGTISLDLVCPSCKIVECEAVEEVQEAVAVEEVQEVNG